MKFTKKQSRRQGTGINTSSLPDIVFMILFFFMAIGMFPPPQPLIENDIITAGGVELEDTGNQIHLRVSASQIQLGYEVIELEDLSEELTKIKDKHVVVIHVDNDTPIGFVKNYIEKEVLKAGKKRIAYEVVQEKV